MNKINVRKGTTLYLIGYILTCILALNGNYISNGYKIAVGQVAREQIKATRDVEDTVQTEKQKADIIANIDTRYVIDKDINDSITEGLDDFFTVAKDERDAYKQYLEDVKTDGSLTFESEKLNTLLADENQVNYILKCSDESFNTLKNGTTDIVNTNLETGIKEADMEKNQLYVEDQFSKMSNDETLNNIGISLYSTYFKANLVVDEEATQQAIDDKLADVEPVIYLKGQTVVDSGEVVTESEYQVLQDLGLIDSKISEKKIPISGVLIVITCLFVIGYLFIAKFYREKGRLKRKDEQLIVTIYCASILLIWLTAKLPIYLSPILASVILIAIFYGCTRGIFYVIFLTTVGALIISGDVEFFIFMILSGCFGSIVSKKILERKEVFKVALIYAVFNSILFFGLEILFQNKVDLTSFVNAGLIFAHAIITVVICFGFVPIFEMTFLVLTPNKLMELSNPDNELIKRSIYEMPGTYHHSLVVANLCETACIEIGADQNLARVGAYYHDIGKIKNPFYFAENQIGENPHDNLTPFESFEIIKNHVDYGIELGKKYKLPTEIIQMIEEHHGNTLVKYFYVTAKNNAKNPDDITEDMFRYTGNTPKSKESGVLMLADTCEAAVRARIEHVKSMDEIELFIDELIKEKIEDKQLVDSKLTFGDVEKIKACFMRIFKGMYHGRVEYPKLLNPKEKKVSSLEEINKEVE